MSGLFKFFCDVSDLMHFVLSLYFAFITNSFLFFITEQKELVAGLAERAVGGGDRQVTCCHIVYLTDGGTCHGTCVIV